MPGCRRRSIERASKQGWALVALDIGVDTSSLSGRAMAGMMAVFSELERGMIGQRTREAMREAKLRGTIVGRRSSLPNEVVDRIVAERAEGHSLRAIADGLNASSVPTGQGAPRWNHSSVQAVLRRRADRPEGPALTTAGRASRK
jgi:DNA invertase Pin-like site-specific DNA recombinase